MNQNLFILDEKYSSLIKDYELNTLIKSTTDILVGNSLFNIFKVEINIDNDYEIFSMNSNKKKRR